MPGISVPSCCFFNGETGDIDYDALHKHLERMVKGGMVAIAISGSNGEAKLLETDDERNKMVKTAREYLDQLGYSHVPLFAGCSAESTRETIRLCKNAAENGANYALILTPNYFSAQYTSKDRIQYFKDVATASPIPVLIYNYPAVTNNTNLTADELNDMCSHPNIAGVKFTCGDVEKTIAVAQANHSLTAKNASDSGKKFMALAGLANKSVASLKGGATGGLCGLANVAPKTCTALYEAWAKSSDELEKLQGIIDRAEQVIMDPSFGIAGTKAVLRVFYGYGGQTRKPLPQWDEEMSKKQADRLREIVEYENSL